MWQGANKSSSGTKSQERGKHPAIRLELIINLVVRFGLCRLLTSMSQAKKAWVNPAFGVVFQHGPNTETFDTFLDAKSWQHVDNMWTQLQTKKQHA